MLLYILLAKPNTADTEKGPRESRKIVGISCILLSLEYF